MQQGALTGASIRRLEVCSEVVFNDFNGAISHDDINILRKLKQYRRKDDLSLSNFIGVIILFLFALLA